ncbi:MAG TPA: nitroreductase family deazaflavin-dependent oxidoreductase [Chloroflexi bacterium]|jgi:deazaflavin-dependent oxidoreductase (nitroreductase family)|nr:nitroreductase family deazaflavin-dependent oxidoreductase [Chloroflexota bacterium]
MGPKWLQRLLEPLAKRGIKSYRKTGGTNRMATMMGFPVVLLTTKGAKSGEERTVSVGGFADGDEAWLMVASNNGSPRHPAWFKNMVRHPDDVSLEVGSRKMKVQCESLTGSERETALARIAAISARYGKYPSKTDREIPIVRLTRLSG